MGTLTPIDGGRRTTMAMATLDQIQRDALLYICDEEIEYAENDPSIGVQRLPFMRALAGDLLLPPDAEGAYEICSVERADLVMFLAHQLNCMLETTMGDPYLQVWHACVNLLEDMNVEVHGSVYEYVDCQPECEPVA